MKKSTSENRDRIYPVDHCHTVSPNNIDDTQEIYVGARLFDGSEITLIFTPEDWLDTFTPTMYKHVKKHYIKYIEEKE
jgi:hypothetical protein